MSYRNVQDFLVDYSTHNGLLGSCTNSRSHWGAGIVVLKRTRAKGRKIRNIQVANENIIWTMTYSNANCSSLFSEAILNSSSDTFSDVILIFITNIFIVLHIHFIVAVYPYSSFSLLYCYCPLLNSSFYINCLSTLRVNLLWVWLKWWIKWQMEFHGTYISSCTRRQCARILPAPISTGGNRIPSSTCGSAFRITQDLIRIDDVLRRIGVDLYRFHFYIGWWSQQSRRWMVWRWSLHKILISTAAASTATAAIALCFRVC